jgi:hypothetical protein
MYIFVYIWKEKISYVFEGKRREDKLFLWYDEEVSLEEWGSECDSSSS